MSRTIARHTAAALLVILNAAIANAAGSVHHLDQSFGSEGFALTPNVGWGAIVNQTDGTFVTGGSATGDFVFARFTADGALDPAFGVGGMVTVDVSGGFESLWSIALQPDGKIIGAGIADFDGEHGLALARVNANGSPDTSFGTGGVIAADNGVEPYDVTLQDDGSIIVTGYADIDIPGTPDATAIAAARLDENGAFDPSFGTGGIVKIRPFADAHTQEGWAAAIQDDGKIVVSGFGGNQLIEQDFLLVRFNADGSLDTSFGDGGGVRTSFSPAQDIAYDVAIQPDGKIVAAGGYYPTGPRVGFALARYLPDGALDSTFGDGGLVRTPFALGTSIDPIPHLGGYHGAYAYAVKLMDDGRIVAAGDSAVARYDADGSLDTTFGGGAIALLLPDAGVPAFKSVVVQDDGKVVAAGFQYHYRGSSVAEAVIARVAPCACAACERCDGAGGCVVAPQAGCRTAASTLLSIRNSADDATDAITWKWSDGEQTPAEALGLPYGATDYALCVYDESAVTPSVVLRASLLPGPACGGEACWKTAKLEDAAKFKDKTGGSGISNASIRTGAPEDSAVRLKGKGAGLQLAAGDPGVPLRVQLQAENGQCWEAVYDTGSILRNENGRLKAVTPSP